MRDFGCWTSAGLAVCFGAFSLLNLDRTTVVFDAVLRFITVSTGWFFVLCVNIYLGVVLFLLFSRRANVRLGGDDARPDFSTWGWLSMLFSAGIGIGLIYWGVAEPMYHYFAPPDADPETVRRVLDMA